MGLQGKPGIVPRSRRKLIYTGVDCPGVDPKGAGGVGEMALTKNLSRLKGLPFDGYLIHLSRSGTGEAYPKNLLGCNLFSGERHTWENWKGVLPQMREMKRIGKAENFALIAPNYWFETGSANKFDWFDNDRW